MRYFAILAGLLAVLLTTSRLAPMAHMPTDTAPIGYVAPEAIVTASLVGSFIGVAADWQTAPSRLEAGRGTLVYNVMPTTITQPILPDIPEPIVDLSLDPAPLMPTDIATVSWTGQTPPKDLYQVTADRLNIRTAPGSNASVVASLEQGAQAIITGAVQSGWVPIRSVTGGVDGWAFKRYLTPVGG